MSRLRAISVRWMCRLSLILLLGMAFACSKDDEEESGFAESRTVIVYIVAENNLYTYAQNNVTEMTEGMTAKLARKFDLIVYIDARGQAPMLLHILPGRCDTLQIYPARNSVQRTVMRSVLEDVIVRFPSPSYGLILWSHGTGWQPSDAPSAFLNGTITSASRQERREAADEATFDEDPVTKTFGDDNSHKMEIEDLVMAIPDQPFEYLLFDACYMGGVEVAYALRDKVDYIISSPNQVLATSFPYAKMIRSLFKEDPAEEIAQLYYSEYRQKSGSLQTAGVSVVRTSELDRLAATFAELVDGHQAQIAGLSLNELQQLDNSDLPNRFDMLDIAGHIVGVSDPTYQRFKSQVQRAIPYANCTPKILGKLTINTFCGLSMYVPIPAYNNLNIKYRATEWSIATGYGQ